MIPKPRLRAAHPDDMAAIFRIRTNVRENHLNHDQLKALDITPERLLADIAAGELCCYVIDINGEVIGFSMSDRRDGQIFALFIAPGHEGAGHGKRLLAAAVDWLAEQGHREAWLETGLGTRAEHFYAALGWRRERVEGNGQYFRLTISAPTNWT